MLAVGVNIFEVVVDDDALCCQLSVKARILQCIKWYKHVGHDAASTIDRTVLLERVVAQGVGKVDGVGIGQFTMLQTIFDVHFVIFLVALLIWLLYAAAAGGVIMSDGKPDH